MPKGQETEEKQAMVALAIIKWMGTDICLTCNMAPHIRSSRPYINLLESLGVHLEEEPLEEFLGRTMGACVSPMKLLEEIMRVLPDMPSLEPNSS